MLRSALPWVTTATGATVMWLAGRAHTTTAQIPTKVVVPLEREPELQTELAADLERRRRLAKASDAWLREAETDDGVTEKTRQEYMDAYTAIVDANDARLFAALERTAQIDGLDDPGSRREPGS